MVRGREFWWLAGCAMDVEACRIAGRVVVVLVVRMSLYACCVTRETERAEGVRLQAHYNEQRDARRSITHHVGSVC